MLHNDAISFFKKTFESLTKDSSSSEQKKPVEVSRKSVDRSKTKKTKVKAKVNVIRKTEDLPKYESIISGANSTVIIPKNKLSMYSVLLVKKGEDSVIVLCSEQTIDLPIDNNYLNINRQCKELGFKVTRQYATKDVIEIVTEKENKSSEVFVEEDKGPVHDRLREIFRTAKKHGTSDIHIEVREGDANIFLRIDGDKTHYRQIKEGIARTIARVAYSSLAKDKDVTFNERKAQDAKIDMMLDGENISIRLATIPASPGFDMVLRILPAEPNEQEYKSLKTLGYTDEHVDLLEIANTIPVGVMVLSGTTGSGKTTTLSTIMNNKMIESENKLKAITIEDPPEIKMKNVTQVPVVRRTSGDDSDAFADSMRATLRCDPDILMPGEIRDKKTGELLISAVQSGHQVFTTLHAPSAIGSVERMREIGISSNILGSHDFISALVYQSLVAINCPSCSISIEQFLEEGLMDAEKKLELVSRIKNAAKSQESFQLSAVRFKSNDGCKSCRGRGIIKREVIAEVILPDSTMKKMFKNGDDAGARQHYKESGGKLILDHGLEKLFNGKVDPRTLERKVGRMDMTDSSMKDMLNKIRENIKNKKGNSSTEVEVAETTLKSSLNLTPKSEDGKKVVDLKPTQ
jgi:type II secretory ATPase GspE/PulE/Tfp pilus assembly ATPase PilB-like protein